MNLLVINLPNDKFIDKELWLMIDLRNNDFTFNKFTTMNLCGIDLFYKITSLKNLLVWCINSTYLWCERCMQIENFKFKEHIAE